MGLVFLPIEHFKETLSVLVKYKNVYLDTAMVASPEVFKIAFETLGYHRVIFGTDQPLNLIRGKRLHNFSTVREKVGKIVTRHPYHWVNPKEQRKFSRYAEKLVLFHWEILLALRKAIQSYKGDKHIKACIFRKNAKRVFGLH
jgi:predicted TIM-barrel fold metal-dependent hydrolase